MLLGVICLYLSIHKSEVMKTSQLAAPLLSFIITDCQCIDQNNLRAVGQNLLVDITAETYTKVM